MVTLLYKTDFHHSFYSRELIGVFTNKAKLGAAVRKIIKENLQVDYQKMRNVELTNYINWNVEFFQEKGQTQGLTSFELVSEIVKLNTLI